MTVIHCDVTQPSWLHLFFRKRMSQSKMFLDIPVFSVTLTRPKSLKASTRVFDNVEPSLYREGSTFFKDNNKMHWLQILFVD